MSRIFCGKFIRAVLKKHGLSETGKNDAKFIEPMMVQHEDRKSVVLYHQGNDGTT